MPFCLAAVGIYLLDIILRVVQSHYVTATIHYLPELRATRVVIPSLHSGWRAGQHIRLSVLSSGMGAKQAVESHPFTVASTSEDEEGMVLYCREAGDWTRSLAALARGNSQRMLSAKEGGHGAGQTVNVLVQGPYGTISPRSTLFHSSYVIPIPVGGPGNAVFSSYSAAMFICGGGGITFGLSATQDVIRDAFDRSSRLRLVDLVWIVQDPSTYIFTLTYNLRFRSYYHLSDLSNVRLFPLVDSSASSRHHPPPSRLYPLDESCQLDLFCIAAHQRTLHTGFRFFRRTWLTRWHYVFSGSS